MYQKVKVKHILTKQDKEDADSDSSQELQDTRKWLTEQNRKKKKSGGFQSMGI